jgi:hypothetical protein
MTALSFLFRIYFRRLVNKQLSKHGAVKMAMVRITADDGDTSCSDDDFPGFGPEDVASAEARAASFRNVVLRARLMSSDSNDSATHDSDSSSTSGVSDDVDVDVSEHDDEDSMVLSALLEKLQHEGIGDDMANENESDSDSDTDSDIGHLSQDMDIMSMDTSVG